MKNLKKNVSLLIFCGLLSTINAQTKSEKIDDLLTFYNENGMFNGMALVAEKGEIVFTKAYGYANFEDKIPFDSTSVFAIASITKPYTATGIMMLKERGLLSYEDKLNKYFPDLPNAASSITIRNLLTHTSGIADIRGRRYKVWFMPLITDEIIYDTLKSDFQLLFEPGSKYEYSNSNYFYLAKIIEQISEMSYREFIEEKIFKPVGMRNSYVDDGFWDSIPNRINGYSYYWNNTDYDLRDKGNGYGNIYSSIYDQFLFDQALYTNALVKQETLKEAYDESLYLDTERGYKYGLGWRILHKDDSSIVVSHNGAIGGFNNLLWRDVTNKNSLIILTNSWWLKETPEIIWGTQAVMVGKDPTRAKISIQVLFLDNWYLHGIDAALNKMRNVIAESPDKYDYSEDLLNNLAFYFIYSRNEPNNAKNVLECSLEIYPKSANLWDSLGEINSMLDDKKAAIICYEKSLEFDPDNENAKEMLDKLKD